MVAKCLLLCLASTPVAGSCSQPAIRQAADELIDARRSLLTIQQEEMDTRVPPAARQGILKLKDAIAHLAGAYMACRTDPLDAKQIELDLAALVPATGDGKYGSSLSFKVAVTEDTRHLVSITATFGIHCGSDAMLLIYAPRETSWAEVLRWQAPPYKQVSGGFWSFQHRISPPDATGAWFVVTSHVMPWCSSTWSNIEYNILRPGVKPKVLLKRSEWMWWGGEEFGTLAASQNSADIRFYSASIDGGVHSRLFIRHYEISGDSVKRVQPVAEMPRDFVDEWIVSPWTEAQHWSAPGLGGFHRQAKKYASEFKSTQKCSDWPDTVQIGVTDIKTEGIPFYFRVTGQTSFTMAGIRTTPDPNCSGPNTWNPGQLNDSDVR
jgi:hypothetical protein